MTMRVLVLCLVLILLLDHAECKSNRRKLFSGMAESEHKVGR